MIFKNEGKVQIQNKNSAVSSNKILSVANKIKNY